MISSRYTLPAPQPFASLPQLARAQSQYEAGEPCSICGHVMQQGEWRSSSQEAVLPTAVLPGFLYTGSYDTASRAELLKAMGITHILNVSRGRGRGRLCRRASASKAADTVATAAYRLRVRAPVPITPSPASPRARRPFAPYRPSRSCRRCLRTRSRTITWRPRRRTSRSASTSSVRL